MSPSPSPANAPDPEQIRDALRAVMDPEIGANIVDVGLVYAIRVEAQTVHVTMTLTSPACPMGDMILDEVDAVLADTLPPGYTPDLELTWTPPWEPALMSEAARRQFDW